MTRVVALATGAGNSLEQANLAFGRAMAAFDVHDTVKTIDRRWHKSEEVLVKQSFAPAQEQIVELLATKSWNTAGMQQLHDAATAMQELPASSGRDVLDAAVAQALKGAEAIDRNVDVVISRLQAHLFDGKGFTVHSGHTHETVAQRGSETLVYIRWDNNAGTVKNNVGRHSTRSLQDFASLAAATSLADHQTAAIVSYVRDQKAALDTLAGQINAMPAPQVEVPLGLPEAPVLA